MFLHLSLSHYVHEGGRGVGPPNSPAGRPRGCAGGGGEGLGEKHIGPS